MDSAWILARGQRELKAWGGERNGNDEPVYELLGFAG
jgi:hypothetical protein